MPDSEKAHWSGIGASMTRHTPGEARVPQVLAFQERLEKSTQLLKDALIGLRHRIEPVLVPLPAKAEKVPFTDAGLAPEIRGQTQADVSELAPAAAFLRCVCEEIEAAGRLVAELLTRLEV